eukprot:TRINITY_DN54152_c0_g1_i1.p1 TRINITY_DN54152_c0_g1~~TRINITY_DN54152_c0_g1_i1.p1  ORF type:complete len:503 (+),score=82.27 TRINITY_DN54152_c0_g1_i1:81-1511(+)
MAAGYPTEMPFQDDNEDGISDSEETSGAISTCAGTRSTKSHQGVTFQVLETGTRRSAAGGRLSGCSVMSEDYDRIRAQFSHVLTNESTETYNRASNHHNGNSSQPPASPVPVAGSPWRPPGQQWLGGDQSAFGFGSSQPNPGSQIGDWSMARSRMYSNVSNFAEIPPFVGPVGPWLPPGSVVPPGYGALMLAPCGYPSARADGINPGNIVAQGDAGSACGGSAVASLAPSCAGAGSTAGGTCGAGGGQLGPRGAASRGGAGAARANGRSRGGTAMTQEEAPLTPSTKKQPPGARSTGGGDGTPHSPHSPHSPGEVQGRTSLTIQNLPAAFNRESLTRFLNGHGLKGKYNFVYVPANLRSQINFGYSFVNFVSVGAALECMERLDGCEDWGVPTDKVCAIAWSDKMQGLECHIERYRNSPVMHKSVEDQFRPAIYDLEGRRLPFPEPTAEIKEPKLRKAGGGGASSAAASSPSASSP